MSDILLSNSEFSNRYMAYQNTSMGGADRVSYQSPANASFGGLFDDVFDFIGDALGSILDELERGLENIGEFIEETASAIESAVRHAVDSAIEFIKASINMVIALGTFDWDKIKEAFDELGYAVGDFLVQISPVRFTFDLLNDIPYLGSIQREIDRFSGGFLTTTTNLNTLFGRAVRGDSISKQELMTYAMLGVQVAAVVLTAGTAAAAMSGYASIAAGQLSKGTLGKTEFGRNLLGALQIAGAAYMAGSSIYNATEQYALDAAYSEGVSKASSELGVSSDLEVFLFQGALMAGGAYIGGEKNIDDVLLDYSYKRGKQAVTGEVGQELSKHIPSQFADKLAPYIVDNAENTDVTNISLTRFNKDVFDNAYSFDEFVDDMVDGGAKIVSSAKDAAGNITDVKLKWPDMAKFQDAVNENAESVYEEIKRTPENVADGAGKAIEEGKKSLDEMKNAVLNAEVDPSLDAVDLDIKIPDIKSPDFEMDADFENLWDAWKKYNEYFNGKRAMYRRQYRGYIIYLLEDGTYYYIKKSNWRAYMLAAIAAGGAIALS